MRVGYVCDVCKAERYRRRAIGNFTQAPGAVVVEIVWNTPSEQPTIYLCERCWGAALRTAKELEAPITELTKNAQIVARAMVRAARSVVDTANPVAPEENKNG